MSSVMYTLRDSTATIALDDGKVNALSPAMLAEINAALDRAEADKAVVVLTGRPGILSAGFDLKTLRAGTADSVNMLAAGFELAARILSFPTPVVVACTGHAIAMGLFLLQSGDYRIGAEGQFRLTANEVAIGLTLPQAALEICRYRLSPPTFDRVMLLAEVFDPAQALAAGMLDRVVPPDSVQEEAAALASQLASLDMGAHAASKLRARGKTVDAIRAALSSDGLKLAAR